MIQKKGERAVVAIYVDPDFYPPTINAILNLAECFEEIIVISRNNTRYDYQYPENVRLIKIGKCCTVRQMENQPVWIKAFSFLKFVFQLQQYSNNKKTGLVLMYDPIALYGFNLIKNIVKRKDKKIWYHNHDMPLKDLASQFSVGGLAAKHEHSAMDFIDFFSLPATERKQCYAGLKNDIPVSIIPNYPSIKLYNNLSQKEFKRDTIKIIFQGFIDKGICLENFIELLKEKIDGHELHLILKGSVRDEYKEDLNVLVDKFDVRQQLTWVPIGPYRELAELTASCDIGIGINKNTDIISKMLSTASNKIYEYAACGLPVLLYDSGQYRKHLGKYDWAFFTDGSVDSLREKIKLMLTCLPALSKSARHSFEEELNFETVFQPVLDKVISFEK